VGTVVEGVPSSELYTVVLSRGSAEGLAPGERASLSPRSLDSMSVSLLVLYRAYGSYLSPSLARDEVVFLRLGAGMRHSMEKAVQLVHGIPNEAASQRTYMPVMLCIRGAVDQCPDY
jgi:hypothetical protein